MGRLGLLGRNRTFRFYWSARVISFLGDTIANIALVLYAAGRGGTAVGLVLLAQAVPRSLGPVAGTLADRVDQRRLMLACDLGQSVFFGSIFLLAPPLPVLLGLVAASSCLATLFVPAGRGSLPAFVDKDDLLAANALVISGFNLSIAVGPAVGGFIAAYVGVRSALGLDALTFVASATLIARLPSLAVSPAERVQDPPRTFLGDTLAGMQYVLRHPTARAVGLGLLLANTFVCLDNVTLVFLTRGVLGAGTAGFGVVASSFGLGMVLATLGILPLKSRLTPTSILLLGLALMGLGTFLTGLAPFLVVAIVVQMMAGAGNGLQLVGNNTLIQETVPRPMLGRVFGITTSAAFIAASVAYVAGGPLLALTSPRAVFLIAGAGVLVALLVVLRILPRALAHDIPGDSAGHVTRAPNI